jgi:Ankyrin repeats (3 copies)
MRYRVLLLVSLALLLRSNSNCVALEPKDIQEWPRAAVEQALPLAYPSDYYGYAARLTHEGDKEGAAFWYYVGEIRFRFYLAANPKLPEDGAPALFGSLHESIGSVVRDWTRANPEAATKQLQRALEWDASTANAATSKSSHPEEWNAVRAEVAESERAGSSGAAVRVPLPAASIDVKGHSPDAALYRAVMRASKDDVARLLQQRANPNAIVPRDGTSAVSVAAMREDPWFLKEVLAHGGDMNIRNPLSGRTPLVEAMMSGQNDNVRTLIAAGADMNTLDTLGMTPLIEAAANQKYELVYQMLIAGADPTISPAKWHGKTLLSVIRRSTVPPDAPPYEWQLKVIALLKQKGLDVEHGQ